MGTYELIFEVCAPTAEQIDALYEHEDALLSSHRRTWLVTLSSDGVSALTASTSAVGRLEALGMSVCRIYEDLVTRSEIARRGEVTAQAVGQWVRGLRQSAATPDFPEPFNYACGGSELWLWSDVNAWLSHIGKADDLLHPGRVDYILINDWLLKHSAELRTTSIATFVAPARISATTTLQMRTVSETFTAHQYDLIKG